MGVCPALMIRKVRVTRRGTGGFESCAGTQTGRRRGRSFARPVCSKPGPAAPCGARVHLDADASRFGGRSDRNLDERGRSRREARDLMDGDHAVPVGGTQPERWRRTLHGVLNSCANRSMFPAVTSSTSETENAASFCAASATARWSEATLSARSTSARRWSGSTSAVQCPRAGGCRRPRPVAPLPSAVPRHRRWRSRRAWCRRTEQRPRALAVFSDRLTTVEGKANRLRLLRDFRVRR